MDTIWLIGELAENKDGNYPMFNKIADIMEWVLKYDDSIVVKHEPCYQIAGRNMRNKIPTLVESADIWYYNLELFEGYDLLHPVNMFWYSRYTLL